MTDPAGDIAVTLTTHHGVVQAVDIASTRPQVADRLLTGQPADEAVAMVPRVFTLCGRAQQVAAELALEAARGEAPDASRDAQRVERVEHEIAQEYLWRALLDWPRAVGAAADESLLALARRALESDDRGRLRSVVERAVLGGDARSWFENQHVPQFEIWITRAPTAAARLLAAVQREGSRHGAPPFGAHAVQLLPPLATPPVLRKIAADLVDQEDFARLPTYDGEPAETGAVARMRNHPLVAGLLKAFGRSTLTRLVARLTELARIASDAPDPMPLFGRMPLAGSGRGLGWVETARGVLIHAIELNGSRIGRYRIVAPTEWNFHPRGALHAGLIGAHTASRADLVRRAEWLVQALDPCVAWTLEVRDA